jgi:hypothetical protein
VQITILAFSRVRLFVPMRISMIALFHRQPPSFFFFPTTYSTRWALPMPCCEPGRTFARDSRPE